MTAPTAYSSETGRTYRLDKLIGKGGFGEVYLATPLPEGSFAARLCVKISDSITGWLREAYFAQMLVREPRALKVHDRFVIAEGTGMRYCLAMEYAEHGDLGTWLEKKGGQPERIVRRELAGLLGPLDALHRGQALHRDLTPFNVFVCEHEQLKLGDFGIATHQLSRHGVTADAFNVAAAPAEIAWGRVRKWQQRDDVYQVGQLAAMLLRGTVSEPMRSKDVRTLPCSDDLKEVIYRCLGARGRRYESAAELIAALRKRPKDIPKARRAGALVQGKPGHTTDVLVRGRANKLQIAGAVGGTKLMEIRRLAAQGVRVRVIGERQFWTLVERGRTGKKRKPAATKAKRTGVKAKRTAKARRPVGSAA